MCHWKFDYIRSLMLPPAQLARKQHILLTMCNNILKQTHNSKNTKTVINRSTAAEICVFVEHGAKRQKRTIPNAFLLSVPPTQDKNTAALALPYIHKL